MSKGYSKHFSWKSAEALRKAAWFQLFIGWREKLHCVHLSHSNKNRFTHVPKRWHSHLELLLNLSEIWQAKIGTMGSVKRCLRNIVDRNKINRSHQSMPYRKGRKGRKSHYQLKDDFVS
ncbi:hypothetical protein Taro_036516 [Colocasia esculenta]|uniref:Uncharacterized protein n=1 Tax=Colocasia esculenta TaxID=4460 RepID=A0A843WDL1_COLES|nr:hypothetical protein [Colocasia esculenta]